MIEVFVGDGKIVFLNEVFFKFEDKGIIFYFEGGIVLFKNIMVKYLDMVYE